MADFESENQGLVYIKTQKGDLTEVFSTNAEASCTAKLCGTPCESGVTHFDHKVRTPRIVRMNGVVNEASYRVLSAARKSVEAGDLAGSLCTYYGKDGESFDNMVITKFTSRATNQMINGVEVTFELMEYIKVK